MAELRDQVSQYIGFEPNKIRLPITEDDRWVFRKIIADQEGMADIVMDDYRYLLQHGHNGKGGDIKKLVTIRAVACKDTASVPPTEIIWDEGLRVEGCDESFIGRGR
ncbi:17632_t:CDS:2, partial [Rhizophagus irregularis]